MQHFFDVSIATKYGMDVATFLNNLAFWTNQNVANKHNFHKERFWVYNTQEAYTILFPYWTRQMIRTIILKCTENNLIIKDNFNKSPYDRTTWFSLSDEALLLFPVLNENVKKAIGCFSVDNSGTLGCNQPINGLTQTNQKVKVNPPIPDSAPDVVSDNKSSCSTEQKKHNPDQKPKPTEKYNNATKHDWEEKRRACEPKQVAQFWGPGHPSFDSLNTYDDANPMKNVPISPNPAQNLPTKKKKPMKPVLQCDKEQKINSLNALKVMAERLGKSRELNHEIKSSNNART